MSQIINKNKPSKYNKKEDFNFIPKQPYITKHISKFPFSQNPFIIFRNEINDQCYYKQAPFDDNVNS